MATLMSATVQVKAPEKLKVYVSQVGATGVKNCPANGSAIPNL